MDSLLSLARLHYVPDVLSPQFFNVKSIITAVGTKDTRLFIHKHRQKENDSLRLRYCCLETRS